jgi:hypothetical protein
MRCVAYQIKQCYNLALEWHWQAPIHPHRRDRERIVVVFLQAGNDLAAATLHYINYGYYEGRYWINVAPTKGVLSGGTVAENAVKRHSLARGSQWLGRELGTRWRRAPRRSRLRRAADRLAHRCPISARGLVEAGVLGSERGLDQVVGEFVERDRIVVADAARRRSRCPSGRGR